MKQEKTYFLVVDKEDADRISETLNQLYGYATAIVDSEAHNEHGPQSRTSELMAKSVGHLNLLRNAFSFHSREKDHIGKAVELSKKNLVNEIMSTLTSEASGMDLITRLYSTIENYEIIGKTTDTWEDGDKLPF